MIRLVFCTDKQDWISTVIRWITWSRFSHVALLSPDGRQAIEATHGVGVRLVPADDILRRDQVEVRSLAGDPWLAWQKATAQLGKPYDWRFIYGWLVRRDWQDDSAWACAELIAWATRCFPDDAALASISPRDLYLLTRACIEDARAAESNIIKAEKPHEA